MTSPLMSRASKVGESDMGQQILALGLAVFVALGLLRGVAKHGVSWLDPTMNIVFDWCFPVGSA